MTLLNFPFNSFEHYIPYILDQMPPLNSSHPNLQREKNSSRGRLIEDIQYSSVVVTFCHTFKEVSATLRLITQSDLIFQGKKMSFLHSDLTKPNLIPTLLQCKQALNISKLPHNGSKSRKIPSYIYPSKSV